MEPWREALEQAGTELGPKPLRRWGLAGSLLVLGAAALALGFGTETRTIVGTRAIANPNLLVVPEIAGWLALVAGAVFAVLIAIAMWPHHRGKAPELELVVEPPRVRWLTRLVLTLVPLAMVAGLIVAYFLLRNARTAAGAAGHLSAGVPHPGTLAPMPGGPAAHPGTSAALPVWWWAAAIVLAALLGLLTLYMVRRRTLLTPTSASPQQSPEEVVEESLDVLRREPDPRRAVIRSYLAMEASFRRRGYPRRLFETPGEYVRRILHGLHAHPDQVTALVGLFSVARFSHHPITEADRSRAIQVLASIRSGLEELAREAMRAEA